MSAVLNEAWSRTVTAFATRRAVVEAATATEVTFGELDRRADRWAGTHLPHRRDLAGRVVVFALPNGIAWLEMFLGLMRRGAVTVPLDAAEPVSALAAMTESLGGGYWWDGSALQATGRKRRFRDREVALIKLTSGSTGRPRPLVFTGAQLLADAHHVTQTMGIGPSDRNYALIPLGHSYGLGNLTLPLIAHGVPLVCGGVALPQAMAADFACWRPTVFPSVPALWRSLVMADLPGHALASLRLGISAGAPLPAETAHAFVARFGRGLHAFYGSSETGGISYDRTGEAALAGGVGQALSGVTVLAEPGGLISVSSAAVCTFGRRRGRDGFGVWVMPDRVEVDPAGNLTLRGRRGAVVKVAGRRVSLAEVEARLRRLAGIREVWVGVDGAAELVLGAALVTNRTVASLRAELQADTASWKVPKRLIAMEAFPVTARGKTDTTALRRRVFGNVATG